MANTQLSANRTEDNVTRFPLMDLPPELWTRVVKMAVTRDIPSRRFWDEPIDFGVPPIAWTCRIIRSEALKLFYLHNTFKIHNMCGARDLIFCQRWIREKMEEGHWTHVKRVLIRTCCNSEHGLGQLFQRYFPKKKVTVRDMGFVPDPAVLYEVRVEEGIAGDEDATVESVWIAVKDDEVVADEETIEASDEEVGMADAEAGADKETESSYEVEDETKDYD